MGSRESVEACMKIKRGEGNGVERTKTFGESNLRKEAGSWVRGHIYQVWPQLFFFLFFFTILFIILLHFLLIFFSIIMIDWEWVLRIYMLNFIDFQIFLFIYFFVVDFFVIHVGRFRVVVALFCIHDIAIWKYIHVLNLLEVFPTCSKLMEDIWNGASYTYFLFDFLFVFFSFFFLILYSSLLCSSLLIAFGNATPSHIPKTASHFLALKNGCNLQAVLWASRLEERLTRRRCCRLQHQLTLTPWQRSRAWKPKQP